MNVTHFNSLPSTSMVPGTSRMSWAHPALHERQIGAEVIIRLKWFLRRTFISENHPLKTHRLSVPFWLKHFDMELSAGQYE
jgi:hypothetical protein